MFSARSRRTRKNRAVRDMAAQTSLSIKDMVMPYFVTEGEGIKEPVGSMPGVFHLSIDELLKDLSGLESVPAILLFGVTDRKDEEGTSAYDSRGIVQRAVRRIKKGYGDRFAVITDVCLCGYTAHGHCGILEKGSVSQNPGLSVDNDATIKVLSEISVSHAESGADLVAPSAMMDHQVTAVRKALDSAGYQGTGVLSYSAKYASGFYAPFRGVVDSAPRDGDRRAYQMDYRNSDEALKEVEQDIEEGADMVMVKPALSYLDVISRVSEKIDVPLAAYNVSGEYVAAKHLSGGDPVKEKQLALEMLFSINRAGADMIITYFAKDMERWLEQR